jgi:hypothetical protein
MPNVVTFDTTRLLIIEIPVFGAGSPGVMDDNETDMQEIYSEWKEFVAQTAGSPSTGGLGFPTAIRQIGGDPISATQNAGITYFMTNGWRFKPAEGNHKWTIVGNVFTDPSGQSVFVSTDGAFTVHTETSVSNLIDLVTVVPGADPLVAEIHGQMRRSVFIDTGAASAGNGYQQTPFNNFTSAVDFAEANGLTSLVLLADATADRQLKSFTFTGVGTPSLDAGGQNLDKSTFEGIKLTGDVGGGSINAFNCVFANGITGILGKFYTCGFEGSLQCAAGGGKVVFIDPFSEVGGLARPSIDVNGGAKNVTVRGMRGGLDFGGMTDAGASGTVSMAQGKLPLLATNTDGVISVRGTSHFEDLTNGSTVDIDGLLQPVDTVISRKLLQNRTHTDPVTGIMTVFDDDDSTPFMTADLFENVDDSPQIRYRGQGAERRNRLT